MFHMLSCFNLKPGVTTEVFQLSLAAFDEHMKSIGLVQANGCIGRRHRHPVMDTDNERDHEYFFVMTFRDQAQCDRSVEHVYAGEEPGFSIHHEVWQKVDDPIFICWEDI